jgi:hypothetical protein
MAEPTIIQEQREVVRTVQVLADDHLREEQEAERRLKRDRESADDALAQVRDAADSELRRAFAMLQDADRMVPVRADRKPLNEIVPLAPASLFDTDLLVGTRIVTAQMEASLIRIRSSLLEGSSSNLLTAGIILGAVVTVGAILAMPFVAGPGNSSWSFGWFGVMMSPLVVAVVIAVARATILRPYSPEEDYQFIRQSMAHVLYMHRLLVEEAQSTRDRRLSERQDRFDETRERIAQSFRQQLAMIEPSIASFASAAQALGPEWSAPVWRTWTPSNAMPRITCVGEMLVGIRDDRLPIPALVPFPHEKALIIKSDGQSRARAIAAIQSILLRLVANVPPGDLRFVLIDPIGQGQNLAPFTAFADPGVAIGAGRAWWEPHQIEQRLHDIVNLIEGMDDAGVFHSMMPRLDASRATGVAEPCRVLVMLDFPTNVDGATGRLLSTILHKGPSHSVHPILMVDTDQTLPYGVNMHELERAATTLAWDGRRFIWQDPDFRPAWVDLDKPPVASLAKQILRGVQQTVNRPIGRTA